jgi:uncharacterized OB-fold protein
MAVFADRKRLAAPVITAESKAFFDAARQGRLLIPVCTTCKRAHWYPRAICPFCASDKVDWREASGKGTIYTFSIMRRVKEPYVIAHVTLAEGPTMLTNIVACDVDDVRIGQSVTVVFQDSDDGPPVPMFELA